MANGIQGPMRLNNIPQVSDYASAEETISRMPDAPGGQGWLTSAGSTVAGFLANPAVGAGIGAVKLIGKGINAWLKWRQEKKARKEAKLRYEREMAESKRRWDKNYQMAKEKQALSMQEFRNRRRMNRRSLRMQKTAINNERANNYINNFVSMVNSDDALRQGFLARGRL